jgi:hypothetical protein
LLRHRGQRETQVKDETFREILGFSYLPRLCLKMSDANSHIWLYLGHTTLSLSLSLVHSLSLSRSLSLSLSLSFILSLSRSLSLSLSLVHSLCLSLSFTLSVSLSFTLSVSLSLSFTLTVLNLSYQLLVGTKEQLFKISVPFKKCLTAFLRTDFFPFMGSHRFKRFLHAFCQKVFLNFVFCKSYI